MQTNGESAILFAPRAASRLAEETAKQLGVRLAQAEEREFDGGEHKMRPLDDVTGRDVYVIQSLHADERASVNDKLCRLLFFVGALKDAGAGRVTVCAPYLCYARKDRRTQERDPVTTRYVAALFEAVGADRIIVLDAHNEAAFDNSFRRPTVRLSSASVLAEALSEELVDLSRLTIASPDIGGVKRAQLFCEYLAAHYGVEVDLAFMAKRRARGVVSGEALVGEVAERRVVIVDDMIATGGTAARATRAARRAGASQVYVAAAHAVFTSDAVQLFAADGADGVLVTDSTVLPQSFEQYCGGRLRVRSIAPLLAATIKRLSSSDAFPLEPRPYAQSAAP